MHCMCAWCTQRSEEGRRLPATGVNNGREPPSGCRESKLGLLEEQQGFLIGEPSPQHPSPNLVKRLKTFRKPKQRLFSHTRTQLPAFLISHRSVWFTGKSLASCGGWLSFSLLRSSFPFWVKCIFFLHLFLKSQHLKTCL